MLALRYSPPSTQSPQRNSRMCASLSSTTDSGRQKASEALENSTVGGVRSALFPLPRGEDGDADEDGSGARTRQSAASSTSSDGTPYSSSALSFHRCRARCSGRFTVFCPPLASGREGMAALGTDAAVDGLCLATFFIPPASAAVTVVRRMGSAVTRVAALVQRRHAGED